MPRGLPNPLVVLRPSISYQTCRRAEPVVSLLLLLLLLLQLLLPSPVLLLLYCVQTGAVHTFGIGPCGHGQSDQSDGSDFECTRSY